MTTRVYPPLSPEERARRNKAIIQAMERWGKEEEPTSQPQHAV